MFWGKTGTAEKPAEDSELLGNVLTVVAIYIIYKVGKIMARMPGEEVYARAKNHAHILNSQL